MRPKHYCNKSEHTPRCRGCCNALFDISKLVESGAIKPAPADFPLSQLFDELRREFSGLAVEKGLVLKVEESGEWANSDVSLVEEVLRNLVSNALKYTQKGVVRVFCRLEGQTIRVWKSGEYPDGNSSGSDSLYLR